MRRLLNHQVTGRMAWSCGLILLAAALVFAALR
jgi:hypothetical protein